MQATTTPVHGITNSSARAVKLSPRRALAVLVLRHHDDRGIRARHPGLLLLLLRRCQEVHLALAAADCMQLHTAAMPSCDDADALFGVWQGPIN
jgi:hypothetical protein